MKDILENHFGGELESLYFQGIVSQVVAIRGDAQGKWNLGSKKVRDNFGTFEKAGISLISRVSDTKQSC
ncbi:MAG TPA: hypothetical protein VH114_14570 [Candidatus Acidoferrum sp.]|nr:hypothetical protein [Candidatus Acidoferrum sp.]